VFKNIALYHSIFNKMIRLTGSEALMSKNRKAITPAIATVVIVVIALAVSIAGEYWIVGAIPTFTQYEELKTTSVHISDSEHATINVKNTGSGEASITDISVNGRISDESGWSATSTQLEPGEEATITVEADHYPVNEFTPGILYEFTINTAAGGKYPAKARAP
jgi:hypothetical protein